MSSLSTMEEDLASIEYLMHNFDSILDKFENLYKSEKLLQAQKFLQQIEQSLENLSLNQENQNIITDLAQRLNSRLFVRESNPTKQLRLVSLIKEEGKEAQHLISEFASNEGWNLMRDDAGITTYYRNEENSPMHSIKIQGIVDSPLFDVMAVIYETELFTSWVPMLREARVCRQISRFRKAVYIRADVPWPIHNRDVCLYGYGVDALEEDMVLVVVRSCTDGTVDVVTDAKDINEEELYGLPKSPHRHVRMQCLIGGLLARPISATSTHVTFINNTDPKLASIPYWFLNLATKQMAHKILEMLRKIAKGIKTNSEYQTRIAANPEVYEEAKQRIIDKYGQV